eukprot:2656894-Amphidinium_carterae.1
MASMGACHAKFNFKSEVRRKVLRSSQSWNSSAASARSNLTMCQTRLRATTRCYTPEGFKIEG